VLPGGTTPGPTTASLALKSNYQHLREGTRVPGVDFPVALYEKLGSRRASHKAAEQSRRDRINGAIIELGGLLPSKSGGWARSGSMSRAEQMSGSEDSEQLNPASRRNSKVMILEGVNAYIKQLQKDVADREQLILESKKEMESMKRKLKDGELEVGPGHARLNQEQRGE
jgi:hypothetical protein